MSECGAGREARMVNKNCVACACVFEGGASAWWCVHMLAKCEPITFKRLRDHCRHDGSTAAMFSSRMSVLV